MLILTCKLGNEIINCYDGTRSKKQLKKWAAKNILLCPVCGKPYEYCHGKVKIPYFRHMDKTECEDMYSEPESDEHLNGKQILYEWIKRQKGVTNAVLEGWLPDTKQRPDIMFEYKGKQYVIEYQCSPIATEYIERHELYQAAGINDIWICGTEKYLKNNMRDKFLQEQVDYFFDANSKNFIFACNGYSRLGIDFDKYNLKHYGHSISKFVGDGLQNFVFDKGEISHISLKSLKKAVIKHDRRKDFLAKNRMDEQRKIRLKSKRIIDKIKYRLNFDYSFYNMGSDYNPSNLYMYAYELIKVDSLKKFLSDINQSNWVFDINVKNGQYTLIAYPRVDYHFQNELRHFCKTKVFGSKKLMEYYSNKELFITDLTELMKKNRFIVLNIENPCERIVEVRGNE